MVCGFIRELLFTSRLKNNFDLFLGLNLFLLLGSIVLTLVKLGIRFLLFQDVGCFFVLYSEVFHLFSSRKIGDFKFFRWFDLPSRLSVCPCHLVACRRMFSTLQLLKIINSDLQSDCSATVATPF